MLSKTFRRIRKQRDGEKYRNNTFVNSIFPKRITCNFRFYRSS